MKLKLPMAITLAVALTAGLWLWVHHRPQPVAQPVATRVKPGIAPLSQPVPANAPKMATITGKPAGVPSQVLSPATSDWAAAQQIVDTRAGYEERMMAVNSLSGHLTDADWAVLQPFLLKPDGLDKDQLGQVIKNRLLDMLCAQNPPPTGLGDVLAQMYRDHQQDDVIRDYALQHLTAYYEQMATQGDSAGTRQDIQNVLWEAVNETSDSIGGTALLALKRLSQEYPGFDQGKIAATALQMAGNSTVGELTHITAFQVCAQLGTADALPVVLQTAQNGETIPVKMSAIGALGLLGGPEQIPFLNSVLAGTEDRLKPAAQHALEQITTRQTQLASQK
jgi:hypothetical protein